jgi:hypothetical protein
MPEVQEVFHMATQKVRPDPDALERQHRDQRRHVAKQKGAVYALVAALVVVGMVIGISVLRSGDDRTAIVPGRSTPTPTEKPPVLPDGVMEAGTYAFTTLDPSFDGSYRITIDVPAGYAGFGGFAVGPAHTTQTGVSAWVVGYVYGDPCHRSGAGALLGQSAVSSVDGLVAALANQRGLHASSPTDIKVDGFSGKYMERTVAAGTKLTDCDGGEFKPWLGTDGGARYILPGQVDLLWIVDVDGVPLVIDTALHAASAKDRAELVQMVESIRIDPR